METLPLRVIGEDGGESSVAHLYKRYWRELCLYVQHSFGSGPPEPEEVVQAAFVRYAAIPDKSAVRNPGAFLYAATRNVVLDYHRHDRIVRRYAEDFLHTVDDRNLSEITPERVLLGKETLRQLTDFLDRMPEHRRRVIVLSRIEGLNSREIADRFGIAENTVRKQLERAIADCLEHLKDPDIDGEIGVRSEKLR